jgi:hypothetical protein
LKKKNQEKKIAIIRMKSKLDIKIKTNKMLRDKVEKKPT